MAGQIIHVKVYKNILQNNAICTLQKTDIHLLSVMNTNKLIKSTNEILIWFIKMHSDFIQNICFSHDSNNYKPDKLILET